MTGTALVLWDLTWSELKEALARVEVALVPVGSTEQHGPNMTFETDTARAYKFCRLLSARVHPRALVLPPVPFGISGHHMRFAGTITLRPDTFRALLYDIVESLQQHGIYRFFFLNDHGGNRAALSLTVQQLRSELGVEAAWTSFTSLATEVLRERIHSPVHGHACEGEVSQGLYLAPRTVRQECLPPGRPGPRTQELFWPGIEVAYSFEELTANGALGDATRASYELGRDIIESALDRAVAFLDVFTGHSEG